MDMTPTRRSKRSCESSYSSPVARSQHKIQKIPKGLKVRASNDICTVDYNSVTLLNQCINAMIPHNWYIILPLHDNECDDIAFSSGQSWQLLYPLMVDLGYVKEFAGGLNVVVSKLALLSHSFAGKHKLNISTGRPRGEKNTTLHVLRKTSFY